MVILNNDFITIKIQIMSFRLITNIVFLFFGLTLTAQDHVFQTFKDTRVINSHTVETVQERKLDFRIGHRFGDINSGWTLLYGLEEAKDVMFSFEYGLSNDFTIGINRTKGAGRLAALINGVLKYRILSQKTDGSMPVSLTILAVPTISTMEKSEIPSALNFFEKTSHRMSYTAQVLVARKFGEKFSLQVMPSYTHRNIVPSDDTNGIFAIGAATRIQLTKVFGIIADITLPVTGDRPSAENFYAPLGIGLEIETGGHIFQINFTNAEGIVENDYIPYTQSNWGDGEFRLGFTISRLFNL